MVRLLHKLHGDTCNTRYDKAVSNPDSTSPWQLRLLQNSRFWILASSVTLSVNIVGFVQLLVPAGSLQTIRIEQIFGFVALALLYVALIISPLTKVFPLLPGSAAITHARRAIGVSAFYYALLHTYITFFDQLGGFSGIRYLNRTYSISLLSGAAALAILFVMTATSLDWAVERMEFIRWKLLHRLVYAASLALLLHIMLIGPHYSGAPTFLAVLTYAAVAVLIGLEMLRLRKNHKKRAAHHE